MLLNALRCFYSVDQVTNKNTIPTSDGAARRLRRKSVLSVVALSVWVETVCIKFLQNSLS